MMQPQVDGDTIFGKITGEGIERVVFGEIDAALISYNTMMLGHLRPLRRRHCKDCLNINRSADLQTETMMAALKR